jgi:small redox-active disulfide protein 2
VTLIPVLQYSNTPILHPYSRRTTMDIKVLGPGCPKCHQTERNVKEAVSETGSDAKVEKVTNLLEIAKYGVFGTPAVVIDGQVKSVGKIPTKDEIKKWILK